MIQPRIRTIGQYIQIYYSNSQSAQEHQITDGRGKLLTSQSFDDGQCYSINPDSAISKARGPEFTFLHRVVERAVNRSGRTSRHPLHQCLLDRHRTLLNGGYPSTRDTASRGPS